MNVERQRFGIFFPRGEERFAATRGFVIEKEDRYGSVVGQQSHADGSVRVVSAK